MSAYAIVVADGEQHGLTSLDDNRASARAGVAIPLVHRAARLAVNILKERGRISANR